METKNEFCNLPPESGKCLAYFQKYAFNSTTGTCQEFIYGGCGGNDNRFDTVGDCERQCVVGSSTDPCHQPIETGPCRAYFRKFAFSTADKVCQEFVYGGCDGNDNRFDTAEECQNTCLQGAVKTKTLMRNQLQNVSDLCKLPPETGSCRGYFPKYAFDSLKGTCEEFIYGGCDGNANRFNSLEECQKECSAGGSDVSDVCSLPIETGPCRGNFINYAYNTVTNTCQEFVYGGCAGNDNRFETLERCQDRCHPKELPGAAGCEVLSCVVPIVVVLAVLLIAAGVVIFVLLRKKKQRTKSRKYGPASTKDPEDADIQKRPL